MHIHIVVDLCFEKNLVRQSSHESLDLLLPTTILTHHQVGIAYFQRGSKGVHVQLAKDLAYWLIVLFIMVHGWFESA